MTLISACLLLVISVAALFWLQQEVLKQPLQVEADQLLSVPAGSTPTGLLLQLEQQGALRGSEIGRAHV